MSNRRKDTSKNNLHDVLARSDDKLVLVHHLERKREFLTNLAQRIEDLRSLSDEEVRKELRLLPKDIRSQIRDFDRLTQIEREVTLQTNAFSRRIRKHCPTLTATEVSVAVYIRGGLSARQISDLLFVSSRAIEKHRQSIRRKLGLTTDMNIVEYLEAL